MANRRLEPRHAERRATSGHSSPPSRSSRRATPEGGRRQAWTRVVRSRADAIAARLSAPAAGALAAAWTAVIGLLLVGLIVIAGWISGAGEGDITPALKVVGLAWLATHHIAVDLDAGSVSALGLGLTLLPGVLLWRAGTWAARRSGACRWRDVRVTVAFAVGVYATIGLLVASLSSLDTAAVAPLGAVVGTGIVAAGAFGGGACREAGLWPQIVARFPADLRRWAMAAAGAILTIATGVAALLAISLVVHFSLVDRMMSALNPGFVGGLLLLAMSVAYLPNVIMWGFGYVSGAGFSVGDATWISPGQFDGGNLPAFPLFAAIPSWQSPWLWCVVLLPLLGGAVAARLLNRHQPGSARSRRDWRERAWVAALVFVAVVLLAHLSAGSLGAGRMSHLGAPALLTGLAIAVQVCVGILIADLLRRIRRALAQRGAVGARAARG